jgi:hypothetical protein
MMKIAGSGSGSMVRGIDPRIRIRIHAKMSWIRNTGGNKPMIIIKKSLPRIILEADTGALKRLQEVTSIKSIITEWLFVLCILLTKTSILEVKPGELFLFVLSRVEAVLFQRTDVLFHPPKGLTWSQLFHMGISKTHHLFFTVRTALT